MLTVKAALSKGQFPVLAAFIISRPGDANLHQSLPRSYPPTGLQLLGCRSGNALMLRCQGWPPLGHHSWRRRPWPLCNASAQLNSELYPGPGATLYVKGGGAGTNEQFSATGNLISRGFWINRASRSSTGLSTKSLGGPLGPARNLRPGLYLATAIRRRTSS
jgi:hypothetical protein